MTWAEEQRQLWIAEVLHIFGYLNREHLMRKFRISRVQASLDLRAYVQLHPKQVAYDTSKKCYIAVGRR